jgi:hypothetical protein
MRKIILADARTVGSLDWELSARASDLIDGLPENIRKEYLIILREDLLLHLTLLLYALQKDVEGNSGEMPCLDYIEAKHGDVGRFLGVSM